MEVGLSIHLYRDQWGSGGSAWRTRAALLVSQCHRQSSSRPSCRKDVVLQVCPSPRLRYKWTLLWGLSLALDGACLSAAGWTWNLIYLVVSLYM